MKLWPLSLALLGVVACASGADDVDLDGGRSPDASVAGDGSLGDGGVSMDAAVVNDAAVLNDASPTPDASFLPCQVLIRPVTSPDLENLAAGPGAFVRLRGQIVGQPRPATPTWAWTVTFQGATVAVEDPNSDDPALIRLPLERAGVYDISVMVAPGCSGAGTATAVLGPQRRSHFTIRVIPPVEAGLPAQDIQEEMIAGMPKQADLRLSPGQPVRIVPRATGSPFAQAPLVPSFVRIFGSGSSFEREGTARTARGFETTLGPGLYDVLIVPEDGALPPVLRRDVLATSLAAFYVDVNPGALVQGQVLRSGQALPGARLMLREEEQPSTLGLADAKGAFELRARPGLHSVRVIAPEAAVLPVLQLEAEAGVAIENASAPVKLEISYDDPLTAALQLTVLQPDGAKPAAGTQVQLRSEPLPGAGHLKVNGAAARVVPGHLEHTATTDENGLVVLQGLPRVRYQAWLRPPATRTWAAAFQTPLPLSLEAGDAALTVKLASAVKVTGQLSMGSESLKDLRVVAIEDTLTFPGEEASALVAADGAFSLSLSPETTYRLRVDPPFGRLVPRTVFGTIRTERKDIDMLALPRLPNTLRFSGRVLSNAGSVLPGTVVQAFCNGDSPDCIDLSRRRVGVALPISEAVAGPDGAFVLVLPDPGS